MSVATPYVETDISDVQIFEYTKTLSLPIDKSKNAGAKIGSVVSVGGIFGVMVTEIADTPQERAAKIAANKYYMPFEYKTAGHNAPGHASVRVHGGAFKIKGVAHTGAKAVGDIVYAHQDGDHVTVNFTASGGTRIGFLYQPIAGTNNNDDAIVVLG